jgi:hypothetical protein
VAKLEPAQQQEAAAMFLEGYARMTLIRLFERSMHRLFLAGVPAR